MKDRGYKSVITGHSLGGTLAFKTFQTNSDWMDFCEINNPGKTPFYMN